VGMLGITSQELRQPRTLGKIMSDSGASSSSISSAARWCWTSCRIAVVVGGISLATGCAPLPDPTSDSVLGCWQSDESAPLDVFGLFLTAADSTPVFLPRFAEGPAPIVHLWRPLGDADSVAIATNTGGFGGLQVNAMHRGESLTGFVQEWRDYPSDLPRTSFSATRVSCPVGGPVDPARYSEELIGG